MQYPYVSIYPEGIDDRTYFCDIDLKGQPLMDAYHSLIDERRYTDANILLSQQNEVHHYSADLINYLEAKIRRNTYQTGKNTARIIYLMRNTILISMNFGYRRKKNANQ